MITIFEGSEELAGTWFVGANIRCNHCGFVGELEDSDNDDPLRKRTSSGIGLRCKTCSAGMFLTFEEAMA